MTSEKMVLDVEGMTCGHCEARVKRAVGALEGVTDVSVDLPGKKVTVEFLAGQVTLEDVKEAIEEQGYEVVFKQ
jgi:copper chaperone